MLIYKAPTLLLNWHPSYVGIPQDIKELAKKKKKKKKVMQAFIWNKEYNKKTIYCENFLLWLALSVFSINSWTGNKEKPPKQSHLTFEEIDVFVKMQTLHSNQIHYPRGIEASSSRNCYYNL